MKLGSPHASIGRPPRLTLQGYTASTTAIALKEPSREKRKKGREKREEGEGKEGSACLAGAATPPCPSGPFE